MLFYGAERVIAIDRLPERLTIAQTSGAETINYQEEDASEMLRQMTGSRGPDSCIDPGGLEARAAGLLHYYDRVKQAVMLESDRPYARRSWPAAAAAGSRCRASTEGWMNKTLIGAMLIKGLTDKLAYHAIVGLCSNESRKTRLIPHSPLLNGCPSMHVLRL
jgi:threonine dehydrogenase-like Zn-dependent dehydrogenase